MDGKHKLTAPNNETLKSIEQLDDHSGLSTLYPQAGKQWDGDLLSATERDRRRQRKQETLSFGIRKQAWIIGLLIPFPLVLLSVFVGFIFAIATEQNVPQLVIPMLLLFLTWGIIAMMTFRKVFELFYNHSLRAFPFIAVLTVLLVFSIQWIYEATVPLHVHRLMPAVLSSAVVMLIWSIVLSYGLLMLWTSPKLSAGKKVIILSITGVLLLVSTIVLPLL